MMAPSLRPQSPHSCSGSLSYHRPLDEDLHQYRLVDRPALRGGEGPRPDHSADVLSPSDEDRHGPTCPCPQPSETNHPSTPRSPEHTSRRPARSSLLPRLARRTAVPLVAAVFSAKALVASGFGCFSDYSMSWCNNHTEESCVHDYTFSVSHFQRKLDDYYYHNKRPPLLEAYFLSTEAWFYAVQK